MVAKVKTKVIDGITFPVINKNTTVDKFIEIQNEWLAIAKQHKIPESIKACLESATRLSTLMAECTKLGIKKPDLKLDQTGTLEFEMCKASHCGNLIINFSQNKNIKAALLLERDQSVINISVWDYTESKKIKVLDMGSNLEMDTYSLELNSIIPASWLSLITKSLTVIERHNIELPSIIRSKEQEIMTNAKRAALKNQLNDALSLF